MQLTGPMLPFVNRRCCLESGVSDGAVGLPDESSVHVHHERRRVAPHLEGRAVEPAADEVPQVDHPVQPQEARLDRRDGRQIRPRLRVRVQPAVPAAAGCTSACCTHQIAAVIYTWSGNAVEHAPCTACHGSRRTRALAAEAAALHGRVSSTAAQLQASRILTYERQLTASTGSSGSPAPLRHSLPPTAAATRRRTRLRPGTPPPHLQGVSGSDDEGPSSWCTDMAPSGGK